MKFTIAKDTLLGGLQRIQSVVERRTTMPILSNVLVRSEKDGISLAATDLEVGIESILPADVSEAGGITVRAKGLLDIVRELPDTQVRFETKGNTQVIIKAKRSVFNVLGLPAEDFPEIPGFSSFEPGEQVRMNGAAVLSMLDKTLYAASTDEARYHLNGVFFETVEDSDAKRYFRMVATDAHRLALVDNKEALFDEKAWRLFREGLIVPRKGLYELRRLLSEGKDDFFVSIKGKVLLVKQDRVFLSMRLIEGKYADYKRIIPGVGKGAIVLNKEEFLASLKRIALMSSDKSRSITFALDKGILRLTSQSPEFGDAEEELPVEYEGESLKIGFNSRYLIDALATIDGKDVIFEVRDKQNPGVMRAVEGSNHTNVVMPMRI